MKSSKLKFALMACLLFLASFNAEASSPRRSYAHLPTNGIFVMTTLTGYLYGTYVYMQTERENARVAGEGREDSIKNPLYEATFALLKVVCVGVAVTALTAAAVWVESVAVAAK